MGREPDIDRQRNPVSALNFRGNPLELPISATPPAFFRSLLGRRPGLVVAAARPLALGPARFIGVVGRREGALEEVEE